jgi:hypothetical protein
MNRTIKAVERQIIRPTTSQTPAVRFLSQASAPDFIAEWQEHGPATLSGHALRKLRLTFVPQMPAVAR